MSVVVPVYNSARGLSLLVERVVAVLDSVADPYELVLVNDGSRDDSWDRILDLASNRPWLRGVDLMRNYGQHNALLCGLKAARYQVIVTIDDDLQNPPEEIPKLLSRLSEGFDVVYGTPIDEQHPLWRGLASRVTKLVLQSAMGADSARSVSAFRAIRAPVRRAFEHYEGPYVSIDVLLTWGTTRFTSVPVRHDERRIGESNYTFRQLIRHALSMMTGFSVLPLQLASVVGFAFTLFGMAVLAYVLGRWMVQGSVVAGFPFLASIIAIFSGAQMFALGIIGEYLARMHFKMMERPAYAVRTRTDDEGHAGE